MKKIVYVGLMLSLIAGFFACKEQGREEVTLSFDSNGGYPPPVDSITLPPGSPVKDPGEASRDGYTFLGWFEDGSTKPYVFTTMPETDKTLTAHWKANQYTITFSSMGGTECSPVTVTYNESYGVLPIPERKGYLFEGWFDPSGGLSFSPDTEFRDNEVYSVSCDTQLVAKWTLLCLRVNDGFTPDENGHTILFGFYPRRKVTSETALSDLGGYDDNEWTSAGYPISGTASDFMKYTEKEFIHNKYRGVYFTSYRPNDLTSESSAENSNQDENGYSVNTVYWFRCEPIQWQILSEENGEALIVSNYVLDSRYWQDINAASGNNYAKSEIRRWLNDDFLSMAFSPEQQALILPGEVDNSGLSTGKPDNMNACENTTDSIFLLSYAQANLLPDPNPDLFDRVFPATDYAMAMGVKTDKADHTDDPVWTSHGAWWLRSPTPFSSTDVKTVTPDGDYATASIGSTGGGVLPALKLSLPLP